MPSIVNLKLLKYTALPAILIMLSGFIIGDNAIEGITWDKMSYDFGSVKSGTVAEVHFKMTNNRKDTVVVENVIGSCGCLATGWPRSPLYPGKSAEITVKFDSGKGKTGHHYKTVTVLTNKGEVYLSLNANVVNE